MNPDLGPCILTHFAVFLLRKQVSWLSSLHISGYYEGWRWRITAVNRKYEVPRDFILDVEISNKHTNKYKQIR